MKRNQFTNKPFKLPIKVAHVERQDTSTSCAVDAEASKAEEARLDAAITELRESGCNVEYLDTYVERLHTYNDLKDVGQMLIGMFAVRLGVTTKSLYEEYGLDVSD